MEVLNLTKIMNKKFEINNPNLKEQNDYYNCFANAFTFSCIDTDYPEFICEIKVNLFYTNYIHVKYKFKSEDQKEDWYEGKINIPESSMHDINKDTAYAIYKGIRRINNSFVK